MACCRLTLADGVVAVDEDDELSTLVAPDRHVVVHVRRGKLVAGVAQVPPRQRDSAQLAQLDLFAGDVVGDVIDDVIVATVGASSTTSTAGLRTASPYQRHHYPIVPRRPPTNPVVSRSPVCFTAPLSPACVRQKPPIRSELVVGRAVRREALPKLRLGLGTGRLQARSAAP